MTGVLTNISNELADTVEKAGNCIARIEARRRMPASGIIWSPDGVIVTSHHVVEQDDTRVSLISRSAFPTVRPWRLRSWAATRRLT